MFFTLNTIKKATKQEKLTFSILSFKFQIFLQLVETWSRYPCKLGKFPFLDHNSNEWRRMIYSKIIRYALVFLKQHKIVPETIKKTYVEAWYPAIINQKDKIL